MSEYIAYEPKTKSYNGDIYHNRMDALKQCFLWDKVNSEQHVVIEVRLESDGRRSLIIPDDLIETRTATPVSDVQQDKECDQFPSMEDERKKRLQEEPIYSALAKRDANKDIEVWAKVSSEGKKDSSGIFHYHFCTEAMEDKDEMFWSTAFARF